jgi:hypothetical protein
MAPEYNPQDDVQPTQEEWEAFRAHCENLTDASDVAPKYLDLDEIRLWHAATSTINSSVPNSATKQIALMVRQILRQQAAASELAGIHADMIVNFKSIISDTNASTRNIVLEVVRQLQR